MNQGQHIYLLGFSALFFGSSRSHAGEYVLEQYGRDSFFSNVDRGITIMEGRLSKLVAKYTFLIAFQASTVQLTPHYNTSDNTSAYRHIIQGCQSILHR